MKHNKVTPGSNLVWESSRMMLPEHREALLDYVRESQQAARPELDEQQLERIARMINEAYIHKAKLSLVIFNKYGNQHYQGQVIRVDQVTRKLLFVDNGKRKWIPFQDILDARFN